MLWTSKQKFQPWAFDRESEIEAAINDIHTELFGASRVYLDVKKLIGRPGRTQNVPDGYLLDLSSRTKPSLYLVEVELAKHDPLRHIAQQLLNFSLSFKATPQRMKGILRDTLQKSHDALTRCESYAIAHGFNNIDYLLEQMIYPEDAFNALVIIDDLEDELKRFRSETGEVVYEFEPFLYDLGIESSRDITDGGNRPAIDPSEIDTIVVPAREEGFREVFLGENMWRAIRMHSSMIPKIRYVAGYQVAPVQAITHVAEVAKIEPWKDTEKYALYFKEAAKKIDPIPLVPRGKVPAPQNSRYTSLARLKNSKTLDDLF